MFSSFFQGSIEVLAEIGYQRSLQELIDAHLLSAAFLECRLADVPLMDIQRQTTTCEFGHSYRIKRT